MTTLLNTGNPISRAEANALVALLEAMTEHLYLTGAPALSLDEAAGLEKLRMLTGVTAE